MSDLKTQFEKFFYPKSIAVVGASEKAGKIGAEIFRNLAFYDYKYKDKVYPVNPKHDKIMGIKAYPKIEDIPDKVDLAVVSIGAKFIPDLVESCGKKGIKNMVIVSGGFKELGTEEGKSYEKKMIENAKKYGVRLIGPNCIGVLNAEIGLDTFFQSHEHMIRPKPGSIAFLTQSGTFGCSFLEWAAESPVGISKFVSYGNRSDVDEADLITYLDQDEKTKVIAIYMEGLSDGRKFMNAAKTITKHKPIVVLKAGRSKAGARAAVSHTGWLGGSEKIYDAAFKQSGIIRVNNFEELFDAAKAIAMQDYAKGPRIGLVSNGAGPMIMAIDEIERRGLELPQISEDIEKQLKEKLPPFYIVHNPVDITGSATPNDYEIVLEHLAKDPNIDILMPFFVFQNTLIDESIVDVMEKINKLGKPVIGGSAGGPYTKKITDAIESVGVPMYPIAERVVAAAQALYINGKNLNK